ncbi:MAG: GAF domain-containing protein [Polyangiaceae bacterium]
MSRISMVPTDRVTAHREGLLALSRALVVAHHGGTFSETLEIVVEALGADAGAAYEVEQAGLVLVAHRGLTMDLRVALERLPKTDDPWFIASRAAKSRRIVVEPDVAASTSNAEVAKLFTPTARVHAVAVPLTAGRQVLGVIVVFHLRPDAYDATVASFLETAAGMITLARRSQQTAPVSTVRREEERMGPLAMAGMLAAHFADDVRGPLAAIGLTLREQERILDRPDLPADMLTPPIRQLIEEAQLALRRAQTVTDQIVSAAQAGPRERLVFADILKEAVRAVTPMADSRGVLVMEHVEADGHVFGRRAELVPAFVALLTNAVQACEQGPRTRRPTVKITTEEDPRGVAVSVEDTGAGVPADIRSRIFDPFFSTNAGAAGIGLTLAKHAIVGHSGHLEISVSPTLGGALFRAVLPRAADDKKPQRRASSLSSATLRKVARGPALLWIDRDVVFLAGARRALDGYDVRVAANASEGEQLILRGVPGPEIIFCEIDLPDRSGLDLHADVARKSPELAGRFVFVTDGILSPERAAYVLGSGCPTLVKPLDLDEIRTLVQGSSGDSPSSRKGVKTPPDVDDPFDL